jgi:hypothetical protein
VEHVQEAVQQHAVVEEGEVALGRRTGERGDAGRQLRLAVGGDVLADPLEVLLARGRPARPHLLLEAVRDARGGQVEPFEHGVHGAAQLGRAEPFETRDAPACIALAHPGDALGVVAVRAALEQRERGERQPARPVKRRRGHRLERRQRRRQQGRADRELSEQLQLALLDHRLDRHGLGLRLSSEPVDAEQEAGVAALELERAVAGRDLLPRLEPLEHPAHRSRALAVAARVDRPRDDQPVDRAGHGHVVEAQPLGLVLATPLLAHLLPGERSLARARVRVGHAEPEPAVRERENLVRGRCCPVAARVGDDHDLELEPLRRVDRQQPHRVGALLLGHRLQLLRPDRLLLEHEAHEPLDVRSAQLLVGTRQARELAHVRVAALAIPAREHGEVVVVLGDDRLAEALERELRRSGHEPLVPLLERAQQP